MKTTWQLKGLLFVSCLLTVFLLVVYAPRPTLAESPKPPIKIGFLAPLTGVAALDGGFMLTGAKAYLEQINRTVAGRKIELIVEDTTGDPKLSVEKARKLVELNGVHVVTGPLLSHEFLAVLDYVKKTGVPLFYWGDPLALSKKYEFLFRVMGSNEQILLPPGKIAYEEGWRTAVLVASDYTYGRDNVAGFKHSFMKAGGKIVKEIFPPLGTLDFGPYMVALSGVKADGHYSFILVSDSIPYFKEMVDRGVIKRFKLYSLGYGTMFDPNILYVAPKYVREALEGAVAHDLYEASLDVPANIEFTKTVERLFKVPVSRIGAVHYFGYMLIRVNVEALRKIDGNIEDKVAFTRALKEVRFESPAGFEFRYDEEWRVPLIKTHRIKLVREGDEVVRKVISTSDYIKPGEPLDIW